MVRSLIVPNLKDFEVLVKDEVQGDGMKKAEAEKVVAAILNVLGTLVEDGVGKEDDVAMTNGHSDHVIEEMRDRLTERVGEVTGTRIADSGHVQLAKAVLQA